MKNTKSTSGQNSVFKPIIATSLALALGVSVASAALTENVAIDKNTAIGTSGASGAVNINKAYTDTAGKKTAGLFVNGSASGITLTFNQNVTMGAIDGSNTNSAYSVLVNSGKATFTSDTLKTITVSAAPTSTLSPNGETYIFKNAGDSVTFKNVAIYAGAKATGSNYGITNAIASGAKFDFGKETNLVGADGGKNEAAPDFTGVILTEAASLGGTLNVIAGNGASVSGSSSGVVTGNTDGKAGGNATGISLAKGLTVEKSLTLNVTGGNGGEGSAKGKNGVGGNATGIASTATAKATVDGGNITINLVAGNNGGANEPNSKAVLTAISNTGAGTLAFANQVGVGTAAVATTALTSNLAGVKYNFGNANGSQSGAKTTFTIAPTQSQSGAGADVLGAEIKADAEFAGVVEFAVTGGQGKSAKGGDATGMTISTGALSFNEAAKANNSLTLTVKGGAKDTSGADGVAKGIVVAKDATFDGSNLTTLAINAGASQTSSATGIEVSGSFKAIGITLDADSSESVTGIKLNSGASFSATTITLGSGSAGLGKTSATTVTALDLNTATFAGSFTADSTHIIGNTTNTTSATLIKNAGNSAITSGTITLADNGMVAKSSGGTTKVIDNTGTLTFGVLADPDKKVAASNASLVIGTASTTIGSGSATNQGLVINGGKLIGLDFGSNDGVIFNTTGEAKKIAAGATIAGNAGAQLSGNAVFNVVSGGGASSQAYGLASTADLVVFDNLTFNASGALENSGENIGAFFNAAKTLTFDSAKTAQDNSITLNVDGLSATGIVIGTGALQITDNATAKAQQKLGLSRFNLTVGKATATTATALKLTSSGSLTADEIAIASGVIGNTSTTTKAVAISVEGGSISNQSIFVGDILNAAAKTEKTPAGKKYILDVVNTTNAIEFASGKTITANATRPQNAGAYGLYSGLDGVGYNFGTASSAEGVTFTVSGAAGEDKASKGSGSDAIGAIIADNAFFEGKTKFTVTGGNAISSGVGGNGGSAIGIQVKDSKKLDASTGSLTLVVDGGTAHSGTEVTSAVAGSATGIQVGSGGTFDASGATLTLQVGNTNASSATALDLNAATFAGSFTADSTNVIGKADTTATSTLIKNTGNSAITSGTITLLDSDNDASNGIDGLVGKNAVILNNTGTLTFGVLADPEKGVAASNASLVIGKSAAGAGSFGFVNHELDAVSIDFGSNNGTIFNVTGMASGNAAADAYGMALINDNSAGKKNAKTSISGKVTLNVKGGDFIDATQKAGTGVGLYVDAKTGTHALAGNDATLALNVDGGVGGDADGSAIGLYVTGGAFSLEGFALDFKIGTQEAKDAYAFYMDNAGSFTTDLIDLSNKQYAQIGNTTNTQKATAVFISKDSVQKGFQLNIADGVLQTKEQNAARAKGSVGKYVLEVEAGRSATINFVNDNSTSHFITAGDAGQETSKYGIFSAITDVKYDFGNTSAGKAGSTFTVTNTAGNATGAILAADTTFEGKATFNVTAKEGSTAVGIRLDNTSNLVANFDYAESVLAASNGTAIALQTTGTNTIAGNITIETDILTAKTKYMFQNTGESATFGRVYTDKVAGEYTVGSLAVGTGASGAYGLYSNLASNYDFGKLTTFKVDAKSYSEAGDTNKANADAIGFNLASAGATLAGNVVFDVKGGVHTNTTPSATVTVGSATGLKSSAAQKLTLLPNSTMKFIVDSEKGVGSIARGIAVVDGALSLMTLDAEGKNEVANGTRGFVFNVGAANAATVTAIDLGYGSKTGTAGAGTISGDLYVGAGSTIGNTGSSDVAVVRLSDYRSALSDRTNGQNIIVEKDVALSSSTIPYILKVESKDSSGVARVKAINFVHDNTTSTAVISNTITAGDTSGLKEGEFYGLYSNIANVAYDFGYKKGTDATVDKATAGTVFKVINTAGNATGAILAADTTFEGKATFNVTAKDGSTAVGIRLDNTSTFAGDFDYGNSVLTASSGTAIALQTTGEHTIKGKITIAKVQTVFKGKTNYVFQNTNTALDKGTTFEGGLVVGTTAGAYTTLGTVGLYNNLDSANYDFGGITTFNVVGAKDGNAAGMYFYTDPNGVNFKGNVVFNVAGGDYGTSATGRGVGFYSDSDTKILLAPNSTMKFVVDSGSGVNGEAVGIDINKGTFTIEQAKSSQDQGLQFEVGTKNATKVSGVNVNGAISSIKIASKSVFGNKDYTNDLSVIRVTSKNAAAISKDSKIVIGDVELFAKKGVQKYIFKNEGNATIDFGSGSIAVGSGAPKEEAYGLYSNIAGVSYNFGSPTASGSFGTTFTVTGKTGKAASGMILSADTRFEGKANFVVTGGKNAAGVGGNAYGIQATGGDLTLTLAESSLLNFEVTGGEGTTQGSAQGIYANNGTLKIVKEGNKSGQITFAIGNTTTQLQSSGVSLDNGVFDGEVAFSAVKAKESAYGIFNENESIIKAGKISFGQDAFKEVKNWAVIQNTGNLTIARDASIVAGTVSTSFNDGSKMFNTAGIYNSIEGATYNLGNLNLDVAANNNENTVNGQKEKATAYGIYSENVTNAFNVAAGSILNISAQNPAEAKAFGGSVNLNLASEAGKQTKVYLNTDGGSIATLTADSNSYIYLSGADKASRVGYASKLDFRSLRIDLIDTPDPVAKAVANTTNKGANFVVLADATRSNGSVYNEKTGELKQAQGSAYNIDGSVSTKGGSDRVVIDYNIATMPSVTAVDNTLHVGLSSLGNTNDKKYVVLAQVANGYTNITSQNGGNTRLHDLVTFNGLKNNGDSVEVQSQVGFDTAKITIQRHDLATAEQTGEFAGVGAVYVSNLVASDIKIDANTADASVSAINTNYDLMSANLNSLSKRMGELRNTDNAQGIWGRVFAGQQTSNFGIKQSTTYLTFQAGYDYNISLDSGVNYSGLALSYIHGSSKQATTDFLLNAMGDKVAGNATSSTDGVEVALYNSYVSDMGLYSDSIVKFGYFTSDLNIPAQTDTYNTSNYSIALSEEIGYRVKLGAQDEWFIDPQAELAYAYISGSDFTQVLGSASMKTTQDAISLLRARVGAAWGYKFDHLGKEKGIKASLYLGTYYAYDVISGGDVNLETNNGTTATQTLQSNGRFVLNVGTDVSVQDNTKFYVDFEKSFGSTMQTDYQVSVGVRYSFGAKDSSTKKEEKKDAAPLKVGE